MHKFNKAGMSYYRKTIGAMKVERKEIYKVSRQVIINHTIRVDLETIYKMITNQRQVNRN